MKLLLILIFVLFINKSFAEDFFITANGSSYSEARSSATKLMVSQGLKIVGQNHTRDSNGHWTVILKVRKNY